MFGIPSPPILLLDSMENTCLALTDLIPLTRAEALVGCRLLPQVFHLALGSLPLGFPYARGDV
jgi:hypothetical protein